MIYRESNKQRKERFRAMRSAQKKELIREKMSAEGLEEGSGVSGATYEED